MSSSLNQFLAQFSFDPARRLYLGAEEELLLTTPSGAPTPRSPEALTALASAQFTYELSACQVEFRTPPVRTPVELTRSLAAGRRALSRVTKRLGVGFTAVAVAAKDMPLVVYPDKRYQEEVVPNLSKAQLRAACRVMGTHIHVGVGSMSEALRVYNALVAALPRLLRAAGEENRERLRLYRVVKPDYTPPVYPSLTAFHERAQEDGFARNVRNCWHLVRISRHGTVEVRLFPAVRNLRLVAAWAKLVQDIARGA